MPPPHTYDAPPQEQIGRVARRGAGWAIGLTIARQALGLITTAITARLVAPTDFGLLAMVAVFIQFLSLFDTGLKWSTVHSKTLDAPQISIMFWWGTAIGAVMWGLSLLGGPVLEWFFDDPRLGAICAVMGTTLLLNSVAGQPLALLKRQLRVRAVSLIETAAVLLAGVAAIAAALWGLGYWALVTQSVVLGLVRLILAWCVARFWPGWPVWSEASRAIGWLRFGSLLGASNWISYFQLYLDSILVGRFHGAGDLGFYSRAVYLKVLPSMYAVSALNDVMIPALSRLRDNPIRFAESYRQTLKMICVVVFPAGACLGVMGPEIVSLLYGPNWAPIVPMLCWQAGAAMMLPILHTGAWLFIAGGKGRAQFQINIWLTLLAAATYAGAAPYGALGMSVANGLLMSAIVPPIFLWLAHRAVDISFWTTIRQVSPIFLASAVGALLAVGAGVAAGAAGGGRYLQFAVKLLVGGATYLVLVWRMNGLPAMVVARLQNRRRWFAPQP